MFAVTPFAVNPVPVTVTPEIERLVLPLFVNVTPNVLVLPRATVPKFRLLVLSLRAVVGDVALPLAEIRSGEFGALLVMVTEPE